MEEIINRVANSALVNFDLEDYYHQGERITYDLKENLFNGLVLKEKDFRAFVSKNDWSVYKDKNVAIICSVDAIIPTWAYMLLITHLEPHAHTVVYGSLDHLEQYLFHQALSKIDFEAFRDAKVIVKGCGRFPVPMFAYAELTRLLKPIVASLMYGEACSLSLIHI